VVLTGTALVGMPVPEPAASVRLLLPAGTSTGGPGELVLPEWTGNEFLLPDGSRPPLRTLTPWRDDEASDTLAVDVVLHGQGPLAEWATRVEAGATVAVSGPGRGTGLPAGAPAYLVIGDESALPAIEQLLTALGAATGPGSVAPLVTVVVEVDDESARLPLGGGTGVGADVMVEWRMRAPGTPPGDALVIAARDARLPEGVQAWAAGEAAAMQRIRRVLFETHGLARAQCTVRGYWKAGRG
jgi:NADPH-dependent ferric siderophore reductase